MSKIATSPIKAHFVTTTVFTIYIYKAPYIWVLTEAGIVLDKYIDKHIYVLKIKESYNPFFYRFTQFK